jgi:hypothetical protein
VQRRALAQAAATVAVLAVALAGCTGSDETSGAVDSQSGGAGASSVPAPSGKYSTLPEPCTALSTGALEELLPGTEEQSEEEAEETLAGEPDLTYDADRLVGCSWERETTEGGHQLELRFERIVSYDDEVSDDEQAAQIYTERAQEHDVDVTSAPPDLPDKGDAPATGEGSAPADGDDAEAGGETDDGTNDDSTDDGTDTGTDIGTDAGADDSADSSESPDDDPAATIAPRLLDDIGDESFLDDRTAGAGAGVQREVTVVFRTSNVVVTVTYDQWHTAGSEPPDSAELQQRAQQVADQLADQLAG